MKEYNSFAEWFMKNYHPGNLEWMEDVTSVNCVEHPITKVQTIVIMKGGTPTIPDTILNRYQPPYVDTLCKASRADLLQAKVNIMWERVWASLKSDSDNVAVKYCSYKINPYWFKARLVAPIKRDKDNFACLVNLVRPTSPAKQKELNNQANIIYIDSCSVNERYDKEHYETLSKLLAAEEKPLNSR